MMKMFLGLSKFESTSLLCAVLDVQCCQSIISKLIHKFVIRLGGSKNGIILAVLSSDMPPGLESTYLILYISALVDILSDIII